MADDQKPAQTGSDEAQKPAQAAAQKSQEAGAQDLLSMWGSQSAKAPVPAKITKPEMEPEVPNPAFKPEANKPAVPVAKPEDSPFTPKHKPAPRHEPKPKPEPKKEAKHEHAPVHEPAKPEKEKKEDQVIEGEIVTERKAAKPAIDKIKEELVKPVAESEVEFEDAEDSIGSQLEEFLRELNLAPRHIFYVIGAIVLIIVIIFGGINGYKYLTNKKAQPVVVEQTKPPTEISSEQTGVGTVSNIGKIEEITTAMVGTTGVSATFSIGREEEWAATELADYVLTFRQLQNAYAVNLNELLNKSINRRQTLENHLAVLRNLYNESKDRNAKLTEDITKIQVQYNELQLKQDAYDKEFFTQVNELNPRASQDALSEFILVSREMTALKARFKALQKIQTFYTGGLNKFALRIRDIELNADPLVAGMKVYDVSGSDLSLIVPVAVEGVQSDKLSSGNDVKILPIGVADINPSGGKDYITRPEPAKKPAATSTSNR